MPSEVEIRSAKDALDKVIHIARVHAYKPIQIGEILHRSRVVGNVNIGELEDYRAQSREWRNRVSMRVVGNISTSSARFQDNLFDENAVPTRKLMILDDVNKTHHGIVENYIYHSLRTRWSLLIDVYRYICAGIENFSLRELLRRFIEEPGLRKSVDKMYEVVAYTLFRTLTEALHIEVKVSLRERDEDLISDFSDFLERVVGISSTDESVFVADIYRVGVAHAADMGLDMWGNFGVAVQVKYVTLDPNLARDVVRPIETNRIVIVCLHPERASIETILNQVGLENRVQGVITDRDLETWYDLCRTKYRERLGTGLIRSLRTEFEREFPQPREIDRFIEERGYQKRELTGIWAVQRQERL